MSLFDKFKRAIFHGDGSHDESDHGNWADEESKEPQWWNEPSDNAFARGMTKGQEQMDYLERHKVPRAADGRYVFWHATPKRNNLSDIRKGSYLAVDKDFAIHQAGRDRDLKPKDIEAIEVRLKPWEFQPGVHPTLRSAYRVVRKFHLPGEHDQLDHGNWADGGSDSREDRARRSYIKMDAEKLAVATTFERSVAKYVNGVDLPDNEPFDVIVGKKHAIEVKTIIEGKNPKITMHPESLKRKTSYLRKHGMTGHTVVIDARSDRPAYYYKPGVGSFRLSGMEKVSPSAIQGYIQ